jgi:hypothetical protein
MEIMKEPSVHPSIPFLPVDWNRARLPRGGMGYERACDLFVIARILANGTFSVGIV